jgi:hypothetical protein
MPRRTRCFVPFIGTKNFDQAARESMQVGAVHTNRLGRGDWAIEVYRPYLGARLTNGLPGKVNRHGKCAERVMPMRLSVTTSKLARSFDTKQ